MTLAEYITDIKDVIQRLHVMFPDVGHNEADAPIESILTQLNFILSFAESGRSFRDGLIERRKETTQNMMKNYVTEDAVLKDAIRVIYADLEFNNFNVGRIKQKESAYYFNIIHEKSIHYDNIKNDYNSSIISSYFWDDLYWANYTKLWINEGVKKLQYFFLVNIFSYTVLAIREVKVMLHDDAEKLCHDILQLEKFYTSTDSEGTCMNLRPVKTEEIDGKLCLFDLHGNIIT